MSYGTGDASFRAAGGEAGLRRLVDRFYDLMDSRVVGRDIRAMHGPELAGARDKLASFLCGWLGGPHLYQAKYGSISIPGVHAHLNIDSAARDAWLTLMAEAIAAQDWAQDFKDYLVRQLAVPAERVRVVCASRHAQQTDEH